MFQQFKFQYSCEDRLDGTTQSITVTTNDEELENVVSTFRQFLLAAGFSQSSVTTAFSVAQLMKD
jgi:hypothetical protein